MYVKIYILYFCNLKFNTFRKPLKYDYKFMLGTKEKECLI